jgi:hypothetical protein
MSAHAYIHFADVPSVLVASSCQHVDSVTRAKIISFDGCPLAGQIDARNPAEPMRLQVEFPFPRDAELRAALVDWLMHHGIHFTVVM